ncbi:glutathione S-transferase family protein [Ramlibacter sp.]|uniref:glutathione S-transferase family protein n=1 Tax=Ramlibacter sp. TaxID=1917967 RepID=UPI003D0BC520
MSLKLYFAPGACSFVPHTLLEATGAPYEPTMVKIHKQENESEAFRAINPRAQVPVLVDGDTPITQILAIVQHIDALFPEQKFLPPPGIARTKVLETLAWMNNTAHPTFTHVFMPHKFAATPETQAELKTFNANVYRGLLGDLDAMARKAASEGREWLGGANFGPVDAYALTLARWGGFAGIDPASNPALWAHVQKVAAHPPVARAIERERLQLNVYKPG